MSEKIQRTERSPEFLRIVEQHAEAGMNKFMYGVPVRDMNTREMSATIEALCIMLEGRKP